MKALRVEKRGVALREIERPARDDEALVRVILSGICNTDLEIARGYAGFKGTIGHEFVGVLEAAPENRLIGQRVVGEINAGCGKCDLCLTGDPRHCPARTVLGIVGRDGAHAEYLQLPLTNLLPVPSQIPDEHAVFTEPLAAACAIAERVSITQETKVAVIGDGKLGLLTGVRRSPGFCIGARPAAPAWHAGLEVNLSRRYGNQRRPSCRRRNQHRRLALWTLWTSARSFEERRDRTRQHDQRRVSARERRARDGPCE